MVLAAIEQPATAPDGIVVVTSKVRATHDIVIRLDERSSPGTAGRGGRRSRRYANRATQPAHVAGPWSGSRCRPERRLTMRRNCQDRVAGVRLRRSVWVIHALLAVRPGAPGQVPLSRPFTTVSSAAPISLPNRIAKIRSTPSRKGQNAQPAVIVGVPPVALTC
jgi:hypothetical protein